MNAVIDQIELTTERLKRYLPDRKRLAFKNLDVSGLRGVLLYGSRGVGKTTFLISQIADKNFLYFSADNPLVASMSLYELLRWIYSRGYSGVVVDEVHFANQWSVHLKAFYDDFPDFCIWASDSSNLILRKAVSDLSRRFVQYRMPMLSFREYLYLTEGLELEPLDIFSFDRQALSSLNSVNVLKLFHDYLHEGIRPVFFEKEYCKRMAGILEKSIYHDMPFYVPSIQENHLRLMNAIIGHLLLSPVPTLNVSGMCSEWGVSKDKLYNLLIAMEQAELIRIIKQEGKEKTYSKGAKIFISDPSIYYCFNGNLGSAREAFVTFSLSERYKLAACKDETLCDYVVDGKRVEVGGHAKKVKKADFVIRDDIDVPVGNKIPMWMIGMVF